jgi:hypothetical protein
MTDCRPVSLSPGLLRHQLFQIQALSQHYSQYDNATALAMSVKEAGQDIASQVGITGFAEGFYRIVELS